MKNIKNKLFIVLTLTTATAMPYRGGGGGFGGGFATGALIGTTATLAATSGSRRERSPEYYEDRAESRRIHNLNRRIKEKERALRQAEKRGDQRAIERLSKNLRDLEDQL